MSDSGREEEREVKTSLMPGWGNRAKKLGNIVVFHLSEKEGGNSASDEKGISSQELGSKKSCAIYNFPEKRRIFDRMERGGGEKEGGVSSVRKKRADGGEGAGGWLSITLEGGKGGIVQRA